MSSHPNLVIPAALLAVLAACAQTAPIRRADWIDGAPPSTATAAATERADASDPWLGESDLEAAELDGRIERVLMLAAQEEGAGAQASPGDEDQTGTDPRGFSTKFMPYFRYSKLKNGLKEHQMTAFGLVKFSDDVAFTYELPVGMNRDFSGVSGFEGGGPNTPNGLPDSGDVAGIGDANIRMFQKLGRGAGMDWMAGFQLTFPTGSEDALTSDKMQAGPMIVSVIDIPKLHSFFAMMHIYQNDIFGNGDRDDISMYIGRWFYMQPLTQPGPGAADGLYLLPEFQPIYDFENSEFSFWVGPEFGKIIGPGRVLYAKPGWGVDAEGGERDVTFELGFRWFF